MTLKDLFEKKEMKKISLITTPYLIAVSYFSIFLTSRIDIDYGLLSYIFDLSCYIVYLIIMQLVPFGWLIYFVYVVLEEIGDEKFFVQVVYYLLSPVVIFLLSYNTLKAIVVISGLGFSLKYLTIIAALFAIIFMVWARLGKFILKKPITTAFLYGSVVFTLIVVLNSLFVNLEQIRALIYRNNAVHWKLTEDEQAAYQFSNMKKATISKNSAQSKTNILLSKGDIKSWLKQAVGKFASIDTVIIDTLSNQSCAITYDEPLCPLTLIPDNGYIYHFYISKKVQLTWGWFSGKRVDSKELKLSDCVDGTYYSSMRITGPNRSKIPAYVRAKSRKEAKIEVVVTSTNIKKVKRK
jgi:hypothetical protein